MLRLIPFFYKISYIAFGKMNLNRARLDFGSDSNPQNQIIAGSDFLNMSIIDGGRTLLSFEPEPYTLICYIWSPHLKTSPAGAIVKNRKKFLYQKIKFFFIIYFINLNIFKGQLKYKIGSVRISSFLIKMQGPDEDKKF